MHRLVYEVLPMTKVSKIELSSEIILSGNINLKNNNTTNHLKF